MWIFNQDGFFSVVQDRHYPNRLMIKARNRDHLETVASWLADRDLTEAVGITESQDFDYVVRMTMPKENWAEYVRCRILDIDYDSVKGHIADKDDSDLHAAMLQIWEQMYIYQRKVMSQPA